MAVTAEKPLVVLNNYYNMYNVIGTAALIYADEKFSVGSSAIYSIKMTSKNFGSSWRNVIAIL
jgi:hypothetical protein